MRALCASLLLFALLSAASAADLKVKVVDPQSAAVAGAQVSLFSKGSDTALNVAATSPEGIATFTDLKLGELSSGSYQIKVLAPGFAPQNEDVPAHANAITIQLHLATASETVVVTATRTPVAAEESGASISTLQSAQLETMNPIASDDAVRFLPGAVINTAGQRGGLSSLFVRGGQSTYNKVIVDGVAVDNPGGSCRIPARHPEHFVRLRCHDQRGAGLDAHRKHSRPRISVRRRWRKFRNCQRLHVSGRGPWPLRLQPLRRPIQQ
jgi:vitamin B12 transporter